MKGLTSRQMSKLYKKARNIGYTKKKAFKAVGLAKRLSKQTRRGAQKRLKRQHPYLDFDMDGKVNKYDCQPRNKWRQDNPYEGGYTDLDSLKAFKWAKDEVDVDGRKIRYKKEDGLPRKEVLRELIKEVEENVEEGHITPAFRSIKGVKKREGPYKYEESWSLDPVQNALMRYGQWNTPSGNPPSIYRGKGTPTDSSGAPATSVKKYKGKTYYDFGT